MAKYVPVKDEQELEAAFAGGVLMYNVSEQWPRRDEWVAAYFPYLPKHLWLLANQHRADGMNMLSLPEDFAVLVEDDGDDGG